MKSTTMAARVMMGVGLATAVGAQDSFEQPAPQQQVPQQQYPSQQYPQPAQQQHTPAPQQQYPQPPPQAKYPQQSSGSGGMNLDQLTQIERQDFGVAPSAQLHAGAMHGPTPVSIPGGQVVTTKGLVELLRTPQAGALVFDVLGGPETLPGAIAAVPAHQAGSFSDQTQQQFGQFLQQATQGSKSTPLVFYCLSTQCWMSYNASLRAINMGHTQVLWYRGGIEAWKQAGLPVQSQQQGSMPQPPPGGQR